MSEKIGYHHNQTGEITLEIDYDLLEGIEYNVVNMIEKRIKENDILDKLNISKEEYVKIVKSVENKYGISILGNLNSFKRLSPIKLYGTKKYLYE